VKYRLETPGDVGRYLRRLSPETQQRIVARLEQIAAAPYSSDISKPFMDSSLQSGVRRSVAFVSFSKSTKQLAR